MRLRLWPAIGLTIGGLLGYGAAGALGAAGGIGTVAAASGLWSGRRSRKHEENLDCTFIRDFSVQTLERDLPLVIERVRGAGLAPVFVVDELDKVDFPADKIPQLIKRLKYLTTDHGFFCFLTGREYYQSVQETIQDKAYPAEHSYFSQRLFVVYTPRELAEFLSAIIVVAEPAPCRAPRLWESSDGLTKKYDELAKNMLVRTVLHRSKLNTIDVMRELDRAFNRGELAAPSEVESSLETPKPFESGFVAGLFGFLGGSTSDLPGPSEVFIANPAHEAANMIQLAVENVLAEPDIAALIAISARRFEWALRSSASVDKFLGRGARIGTAPSRRQRSAARGIREHPSARALAAISLKPTFGRLAAPGNLVFHSAGWPPALDRQL